MRFLFEVRFGVDVAATKSGDKGDEVGPGRSGFVLVGRQGTRLLGHQVVEQNVLQLIDDTDQIGKTAKGRGEED
jgi:hypothetical protein